MGYALLYESMLDSVLIARDRFLKTNPVVSAGGGSLSTSLDLSPRGRDVGVQGRAGVMVPSQCRMLFGLCAANDIYKDRVEYWSDVYG